MISVCENTSIGYDDMLLLSIVLFNMQKGYKYETYRFEFIIKSLLEYLVHLMYILLCL